MPDVTASYGTPFDFIAFFSYIFDDHSCLNCYFSTKLSLIVYLTNTDVKMPDVTTSYGKFLNFKKKFNSLKVFFEFCTDLTNIHV